MKKEKKVRKIKPYTPTWERLANQLARNTIRIKACGLCGYPLIDGYVCHTCGKDDTPDDE